LLLLKIPFEPEFERRGEFLSNRSAQVKLAAMQTSKRSAGIKIVKLPIHGYSDGGVAAAAQLLVSRKQGRIRQRDVRGGGASHRPARKATTLPLLGGMTGRGSIKTSAEPLVCLTPEKWRSGMRQALMIVNADWRQKTLSSTADGHPAAL